MKCLLLYQLLLWLLGPNSPWDHWEPVQNMSVLLHLRDMGAPDSRPQIWVCIILGLFQVALILSTTGLLGVDSGPRESHQQRGVEFFSWKWGQPFNGKARGIWAWEVGGNLSVSAVVSIQRCKNSDALWARNLHRRS